MGTVTDFRHLNILKRAAAKAKIVDSPHFSPNLTSVAGCEANWEVAH